MRRRGIKTKHNQLCFTHTRRSDELAVLMAPNLKQISTICKFTFNKNVKILKQWCVSGSARIGWCGSWQYPILQRTASISVSIWVVVLYLDLKAGSRSRQKTPNKNKSKSMRIHAVLCPAPDLQHWKKTLTIATVPGTDTIKAEKKNRKNNWCLYTGSSSLKIHQLCDMKKQCS